MRTTTDEEPDRSSPGGALSRKMSTLARKDTAPSLALRRVWRLHRVLRFRLQLKVPGNNRRTIDVALTRARLAVFVDGCFWHGCPDHGTSPRANADWWEWKIDRNRLRDDNTDHLLASAGWKSLRAWEHEPAQLAAARVLVEYRDRLPHRHG